MRKFLLNSHFLWKRLCGNQLVKIMKVTAFFLLVFTFNAMAFEGYSQRTKVSLSLNDVPLKTILSNIEEQSNYYFVYNLKTIEDIKQVSIDVEKTSVKDVLDMLFKGNDIQYEMIGKQIILKKVSATGSFTNSDLFDQSYTTSPAWPPLISSEKQATTRLQNPVQKEITGKVTDKTGNPLPGVTVVVKGATRGTATDINGFFKIEIADNENILIFSFIGMKTQEISLNSRTFIELVMEQTISQLKEVVIISTGFQTISKERATGSYSNVSEKTIQNRPYANLESALNGQVAGMVSDPATGFTIRGRSSLTNNIERAPLLVVDGFPVEGGFGSINPNDVKSVDVLKDAAASSIYGARAANGVIVITTKGTGPKGGMNVSYNSFISVGGKIDLDNYMNIADAKSQIDYEDKIYNIFKGTSFIADPYSAANGSFRGIRSPYTTLLIELDKGNITREYFDKEKSKMLNTSYKDDVNKYLLRNYLFQQHNLIISGTGDRNSYKFSALFDDDQTSYQNNNDKKVLLNFTNIYTISKNIKYHFSGNFTSTSTKNNGVSLSQLKSVTAPWTKLIDEEGNYTRMNYQNYEPIVKAMEQRLPYSMRYNILEESSLKDNSSEGLDLRLSNQFEFKIAKGLQFSPMFQYEKYTSESVSIYDEKMYASRNYANIVSYLDPLSKNYFSYIPKGGIYRKNSESDRQSLKFRAQIDFNRTIKDKHEIVALAGAEAIATTTKSGFPETKFGYNSKGLNYALFDYNSDRLDMFGNAVLENSNSYEGELLYDFKASGSRQASIKNERFVAGFFNASYTYDRRYTASVSLRTDASNYVAKTVRDKFSPFYSMGLLWNVKNEKFMKNVAFVDRLAVRTSYGVTGLAAGKNSVMAVTVFSSQSATPETGNLTNGYLSGRDNDFLTWEKTYSTNIATDFSLFNEALTGSIDIYRRHTKDLLSSVQTSQVVQSTQKLDLNLGELLNQGIEISLGTSINITPELSWNGNLNFDYNYNEVLKYDYINPTLFYYLGSNRGGYIPGLPTDFLLMTRIVGTTKDGYYIQEKKNGELVVANNTSNSFSSFGRSTIPGLKVSDDDRVFYQGRTTPPATLGFTNSFSYKGFTLMAIVTGKFGHKFRAIDQVFSYGLTSNNYSATGMATLQDPSAVATTSTGNVFPSKINQVMLGESNSIRNYYSDAVVADASLIRLSEIYLGYEFPKSMLGNADGFFKSVNIFTQARNLGLLWKANKLGLDPDYPIGSVKALKVFTFGVKLKM